jgi:hypothetical protein
MSDNKETEFVDGLIVKAPRDGAPDFIKAGLSIKRLELIAWLTAREGDWVNVDIKESKNGKWYAAVDPWKPKAEGERNSAPAREGRPQRTAPPADFTDDVPF